MSLTCDNTTDACPGTKLTCTCSVPSDGLIWRLPGSENIIFDNQTGVGSNKTAADGTFVAVLLTDDIGGETASMLISTATESLVNGTIVCAEDTQNASAIYTIIFAG